MRIPFELTSFHCAKWQNAAKALKKKPTMENKQSRTLEWKPEDLGMTLKRVQILARIFVKRLFQTSLFFLSLCLSFLFSCSLSYANIISKIYLFLESRAKREHMNETRWSLSTLGQNCIKSTHSIHRQKNLYPICSGVSE